MKSTNQKPKIKRAILLVGFSNWGKSTQLFNLFDRRRFGFGRSYSVSGIGASFCVESHSNDDHSEQEYLRRIGKRLSAKSSCDLFGTLCPTRERRNDSKRILRSKVFTRFDEIYLLLLKHKWDLHAELRINEIQKFLSSVGHVRLVIIDAGSTLKADKKRLEARTQQIVGFLKRLYS